MGYEFRNIKVDGLDNKSFYRGRHFQIQELLYFVRIQSSHYWATHQDEKAKVIDEIVSVIERDRERLEEELDKMN
jgi:hypothetical protein